MKDDDVEFEDVQLLRVTSCRNLPVEGKRFSSRMTETALTLTYKKWRHHSFWLDRFQLCSEFFRSMMTLRGVIIK
jgi:hypothetical protein